MRDLAQALAPTRVGTTHDLGVDPEAKEALLFAVLANETLFGHPGNVPTATGAVGPRVLGKITF
jgi:anhydro-N-acetylmuramic acid kinase